MAEITWEDFYKKNVTISKTAVFSLVLFYNTKL